MGDVGDWRRLPLALPAAARLHVAGYEYRARRTLRINQQPHSEELTTPSPPSNNLHFLLPISAQGDMNAKPLPSSTPAESAAAIQSLHRCDSKRSWRSGP